MQISKLDSSYLRAITHKGLLRYFSCRTTFHTCVLLFCGTMLRRLKRQSSCRNIKWLLKHGSREDDWGAHKSQKPSDHPEGPMSDSITVSIRHYSSLVMLVTFTTFPLTLPHFLQALETLSTSLELSLTRARVFSPIFALTYHNRS